MKVFIDKTLPFFKLVNYSWKLFSLNQNIECIDTDNRNEADFIISESADSDIKLAGDFYRQLLNGQFGFKNHFREDCIIRTSDGNPDYLATAFYMVNSIQEYNSPDKDEIGRFPFSASYQYRFENIQTNLVQQYFDKLKKEHPKLSLLKKTDRPTKIFLSHDLDSINGALLQDGMAALKRGNIPAIFRMMFNAVLLKPDWLNMDKIMQIESEYDAKSVFFWLVNKGKVNARMTNSDYAIHRSPVRKMIASIEKNGWENGLHKSISTDSFQQEIQKLGVTVNGNRYHYLRFSLPAAYDEIEESGLKLDASLGFAENYGFRNSYGLPFKPFNLKERKEYSFVEVPLNVMDGTFQRYQKIPVDKTAESVIRFFEENNRNCILSVLWHNTFFTDYKYRGYLREYKKILAYCYDSKFSFINTNEIIDCYLK